MRKHFVVPPIRSRDVGCAKGSDVRRKEGRRHGKVTRNFGSSDMPLTHSLLDKLTVIVGHCELLAEAKSEDLASSRHLHLIRQTAQSMASKLKDHECEHIALRNQQQIEIRQAK